jgi:hypothetical protein
MSVNIKNIKFLLIRYSTLACPFQWQLYYLNVFRQAEAQNQFLQKKSDFYQRKKEIGKEIGKEIL